MSPQRYCATVLLFALCIVTILAGLTFAACKQEGGIKEEFEELEFRTIHRPHLTYLIDVRYMLCFATRKPDFQDLVQLECTKRLLDAVEDTLQNRAVDRTAAVDAGRSGGE